MLAVDTSASIDRGEFKLQMEGLARAFRDPAVVGAIRGVGDHGIAVSLVQWGVGLQQKLAVGWTHVRDASSAAAFADAIEASPRHFVGQGTGITRALWFAAEQFEDNGFAGRRRVIDISADGRNNAGGPPGAMRDRVAARAITINALAVLDGDMALGGYFASQVAGGTASFVVTADSFADFARAIRRKLLREISAPVSSLAPEQPDGRS